MNNIESIPAIFHQSWHPFVHELFQSQQLKKLKYEILKDQNTFYPKREDIFNVFSMPLDKIRVCLIGQDPYYNGAANGYAFAVNENRATPFSLGIIAHEVGHVLDRTLKPWIEQRVFLLNTSLTVEKDKPNSHKEYWRNFMANIISVISKEVNPVWLLWGRDAKDYETLIRATVLTDSIIFRAAHPASEAKGRSGGFLGCNHFNLVNEYFESINEKQIIW